MLNRIIQFGTIIGAAALALLLIPTVLSQSNVARAAPNQADTAPTRVIAVSGTGRANTSPNQATFTIGVQITAPTLAEATQQASANMTKVMDAIKAQGVDSKDIQTSTYSVNPITNYKEGQPPQITGYQVMNVVTVTVKKIDTLGKVLDAGMSAGANYLGGIYFGVADSKPFETQARTAAVQDATAKAQTLAQAAGVKLGKVLSIVEGASYNPLPVANPRVFAAEAGSPGPVETGTMEISVNVEMRFEIAE